MPWQHDARRQLAVAHVKLQNDLEYFLDRPVLVCQSRWYSKAKREVLLDGVCMANGDPQLGARGIRGSDVIARCGAAEGQHKLITRTRHHSVQREGELRADGKSADNNNVAGARSRCGTAQKAAEQALSRLGVPPYY